MRSRVSRFLSLALAGLVVVLGVSIAPAAGATATTALEETLTGTVVDNNGAAVEGVRLRVTGDGFNSTVTTDGQGVFVAQVPTAGDYLVTPLPKKLPKGVTIPDKVASGVTMSVPSEAPPTITLRRMESLGGFLRDRDGDESNAVEGATVTVTSADGSFTGSDTSDQNGEWEVFLPGPGDYDVTLETDTLPDGVELSEGESDTLTGRHVAPRQQTKLIFPLGTSGAQPKTFTQQAIERAIEGLRFGLLLALAALGLSLIFGTTGLVNFAHGELLALGAIVALILNQSGVTLVLATLITIVVCALVGGAQEVGLWRPLRKRKTGLIAMMIVTIGLSLFARFMFLFIIGGENQSYEQYVVQGSLFDRISLTPRDLWSMLVALVVLLAVGIGITRTQAGKAMRAVSDNPALASASGIDVNRVILWVWVSGGALAGLSGVLLGLAQQVKHDMGFNLLLLIFAGVILGGLGTAFGAMVGSLVVGMVVTLSTLWIPAELKNVAALVILIVILLVRPQGILGRAERVG